MSSNSEGQGQSRTAAPSPAPQLVLIVQERLKTGSEEAYAIAEAEIASVCARLKCPNPYLALESITAPKQVWWLNVFASAAEKLRVEQAYASNEPLIAALTALSERKRFLTEEPQTTLAAWRGNASSDALRIGGARYFVVTTSTDERPMDAPVFESEDGRQFFFSPAATLAEAEHLASGAVNQATVFLVQPRWSFPDATWVAADPEFWAPCLATPFFTR